MLGTTLRVIRRHPGAAQHNGIIMHQVLDHFETDSPVPVSCTIKGHVPGWLKGSLYRNGPGRYKFGEQEMRHFFDGMACIHKWTFDVGQVHYQNRLLETDAHERNKAANRILVGEFGTAAAPDPCKTIFKRYFSYYMDPGKITDNTLVNLMNVGDQLYAMTETTLMNRVDPEDLHRLNQVDLKNYVAVHMASAHPLQEADGTTYNYGTSYGAQCYYNLVKIPPTVRGDPNPIKKAELVGKIPSQWPRSPCYFHSFGMTDNYFIFFEQPLAFDLFDVATSHILGKPIADTMKYYPECQIKIHVMHKFTGAVIPTLYVAKPNFLFHHVNAYEEDKHLVVDVCCYENSDVVMAMMVDNIRKGGKIPEPILKRFVIPLGVHIKGSKIEDNLVSLPNTSAAATMLEDGTVYCTPQVYEGCAVELPRINERFIGKKYRYAYGVTVHNLQHSNQMVKLDTVSKEQRHWEEEGYTVGEPVFVPAPHGQEEDDGVVLAPCISLDADWPSFLVFLDARTMREIGRAEVPDHIQVPYSFHGIYIHPDTSLHK